MRAFLTLWRRELTTCFCSPIAYVMIIFFLIMFGFSFWMLAALLSQSSGDASVMQELFASLFFWIALFVIVPIITMRAFAEEFRAGTIETLMTAPVSDVTVVLAKYAGALTFYCVMWVPTVAYVYILKYFSPLTTQVSFGPIVGGYLGALLVGALYISIGIFASSVTKNQMVSAIVCFSLISVAFFAGFIHFFIPSDMLQAVGGYISSALHMEEFSRGQLDSRRLVFYLSITLFMLFVTVKSLESRRWK